LLLWFSKLRDILKPGVTHIVLLGDSVFDNAAYVAGGPDVVEQLRRHLPADARASLLAVDGSVMASVPRQLERLPGDATHLVLSIGGYDALGYSAVLAAPSRSVAETLMALSDIGDQFQAEYASTLDRVLDRKVPTAVCTIYDVRYTDPMQRRVAITALAITNDRITREAFRRGLPLLDLRLICSEDGDFANPIEPSVQGGDNIAAAIASFASPGSVTRRSEVIIS
jgi:hypothetical protein